MSDTAAPARPGPHSHVFLGAGHAAAERRTWAVIALCGFAMAAEVAGGLAFNSVALVADGLHMSTHAGALLLAALAYRYARRHAADRRFVFGTGKLGDLAGFASAVALAMIALLIGCEAASRLVAPVPIAYGEAIPIALFGLAVNVASAWLLSGGHGHHHGHGQHHDRGDHHEHGHGGGRHAHDHHDHGAVGRDNNLRAALVHVAADAAVSALVIAGLVGARAFGWPWMDAAAGLVGAAVIANWSYGLARDTGAVLLDMAPDAGVAEQIRRAVEEAGDSLSDLHVWRLGPGHLGAIVSVAARGGRDVGYYRERLAGLPNLSHLTVEVDRAA